MFANIIEWILNVTQGLGYFGVGILMAIESSFIPLPSEIIIPPAAYLASQGKMNLIFIIIAGVIGSLLGAMVNYFLSLSLGRLVVYKLAGTRLARLIFITPEKIGQVEKYFLANSNSATFFGRLIPVVRHLISIPAGFCRMPFGSFVFYTTIGATVWVSILASLGYFIGANQVLLRQYYREIYWGLLVIGILWIVRKIWKWRKNKKVVDSTLSF